MELHPELPRFTHMLLTMEQVAAVAQGLAVVELATEMGIERINISEGARKTAVDYYRKASDAMTSGKAVIEPAIAGHAAMLDALLKARDWLISTGADDAPLPAVEHAIALATKGAA